MVIITLPDGSTKEFEGAVSGFDVSKSIGEGLAKAALAIDVDGVVQDMSTTITKDAKVAILTFKDDAGKQVFWHSAAHVLAMAVLELFPKAKLTIGPPVEEGFYYDFAIDHAFGEEDLKKIQKKMRDVADQKLKFEKIDVTYDQAKKEVKSNKYKLEILEQYKDTALTFYQNTNQEGKVVFSDLCRGPHVPHTGYIKAALLTKVSAAYWRGDAKNDSLQRIYGIAFPDKQLLKDYQARIEEALKRDHRVLGKKLDLVMFHEYAPGAPFFLPRGTIVYNALVEFIRSEYKKRGYQEVITPQMYNQKLWETSGHWEHYQDDMFIVDVEGEKHSLKPMNCPSHCLIFNRESHSYRDLPIRIADFCSLHRNELSGTLSGMTRVRKFAQDDAHIFCRLDQVQEEVTGVLTFIQDVWIDVFGFELTYSLSTRPEKALGDKKVWDKAEQMLKDALDSCGIEYTLKEGDGAFYGPKIDIDLEDALGRKWQCPTCQLDFNLPQRFKTVYEGEDGKKHECVMIHRAVLGSLERFMAILIEHYAGALPLWISPEQVRILAIADRHHEYTNGLASTMRDASLRVGVDDRAITVGKKIREAQLAKVNYILVIGDAEVEKKVVNVRTRDNVVHGEMDSKKFVKALIDEVYSKGKKVTIGSTNKA